MWKWKYIKNEGNANYDTLLGFGDASSCLTFKQLSAWKRACAVSFEVQMSQTSSSPFRKSLAKLYQEKVKSAYNGLYNFYGLLNFFTISSFKVL